jgi:hypothetical protein
VSKKRCHGRVTMVGTSRAAASLALFFDEAVLDKPNFEVQLNFADGDLSFSSSSSDLSFPEPKTRLRNPLGVFLLPEEVAVGREPEPADSSGVVVTALSENLAENMLSLDGIFLIVELGVRKSPLPDPRRRAVFVFVLVVVVLLLLLSLFVSGVVRSPPSE